MARQDTKTRLSSIAFTAREDTRMLCVVYCKYYEENMEIVRSEVWYSFRGSMAKLIALSPCKTTRLEQQVLVTCLVMLTCVLRGLPWHDIAPHLPASALQIAA